MRKSFDTEALAVIGVLAFTATYAASFGFVTPDSWNYVRLAQSSIQGDFCQVNGSYFAVFPCGYPIILAISSFSINASTIIIISKFVNAVLLFLSFIFFRKFFSSLPTLGVFVILSPLTLFVARFTWSENLFIFATALTLLQLKKLASETNFSNIAILQLALIIGISSRYFFAPFAFLIWLSVLIVYGRRVAFRTFPVFLLSGFLFLGYYSLNERITGFATGTKRIESPETTLFLVAKFVQQLILRQIPVFALVLLVFCAISRTKISLRIPGRSYAQERPELLLTLLVGLAFLALAFSLRLVTQYDIYDVRTLGFGVTLIVVSVFGFVVTSLRAKKFSFIVLFVTAVLSLSLVARNDIQSVITSLLQGNYSFVSVQNQIEGYKSESLPVDVDAVVAIAVPQVGAKFASNAEYFYGNELRVIQPAAGPVELPESLGEFIQRVDSVSGKCIIDFRMFPTKQSLLERLESTFAVDVKFDIQSWEFVTVRRRSFDPQLAKSFVEVFRPGGTVDCTQLRG